MTINIALATHDGIILGCDSLSSSSETVVLPYGKGGSLLVQDEAGNPIVDGEGKFTVKFSLYDTQQLATTVIGGVNKMFCVYEDDDTCVAAVTAGMATLAAVTIAENARRFRRKLKDGGASYRTVADVATEFKTYMHDLWRSDFDKAGLPDIKFFPTVQFIVAGHGRDDDYGKVFRIDLSDDAPPAEQFTGGDHMGVCWGGVADYVERLLRGSDSALQYKVSKELAKAMKRQREGTVADLSKALTDAGLVLPESLNVQVREEQLPTLPWGSVAADVDYGNLSTQYAVDFVELLVNIQSGMQRFARGIPVVGGRTHIGVLKRGERFEMLNEASLQHRHTGYANDF